MDDGNLVDGTLSAYRRQACGQKLGSDEITACEEMPTYVSTWILRGRKQDLRLTMKGSSVIVGPSLELTMDEVGT